MTSNNLDEKQLLARITDSFHHWGIHCLTDTALFKAKANDPSVVEQIKRLLFDLVVLHIFQFSYTVDQLNIQFEDVSEMESIILAHLCEMQCPLLCRKGEEMGLNFMDSRMLLLACGWVMAVSQYFNRIQPNLLEGKLESIYKVGAVREGGFVAETKTESLEMGSRMELIGRMMKKIQGRRYHLDSLFDKKRKLLNKLDRIATQSGVTVADILGSNVTADVQAKELELKRIIQSETKALGMRQYFWVWLEQKVIPAEYQKLNEMNQDFRVVESARRSDSLVCDLNYVRKFLEVCKGYQQRMNILKSKIDGLGLSKKRKYKEIDSEINFDLKAVLNGDSLNLNRPSFIGMEIASHMAVQTCAALNESEPPLISNKARRGLRKRVKQFVQGLEGLSFM